MSVLGKVTRQKYGAIHTRHAIVEDLTGPAADLTIAAAGTGDIVLNVASGSPRDIQYAGVESIAGLPAGVYIAGIAFDKAAKTLTITLYNSDTANPVTITANSVTVRVISIS